MPKQTQKRRPDPFDGSAQARLSRMGILTEIGAVDEAVMQAFIRIFAASFFDDLCDACEALEQISNLTSAFRELEERKDPQRIFLLISLQYDALRKPLPDPIWWLAGHSQALERFSLGFVSCLSQLMADLKEDDKEDGPDEITDCGAQ